MCNTKSKIAILGDTHFSIRSDSVDFHNYFERFYTNVFFPYLIDNSIDTIIQTGDLFDRRKFINFNSLYLSRKYFFDKCKEYNIKLYVLLGNHCVYYRNTLSVNSPELLLGEYDNIVVFNRFETINVYGINLDIIPWICDENREEIFQKINESKSQICFGHFEINGFEMDRGNFFKGGNLERKDLSKYDMVISGHFHHKSNDGHIYYVGTPTQLTWSDFNDSRGFHIFDVDTRELKFIENPYQIFHKILYDDLVQDSSYWVSREYAELHGAYIKIVVINKKDPFLFDTVMDNMYKAGVCDIEIVEDFTEVESKIEDDVDQAEDTLTSLNKFIDNRKTNVDSDKLKGFMREVYIEALNKERTG